MTSDQTILDVRGLTTHLGSGARAVRAVDGIDLRIETGETYALLGESGCGKSMTALSITRLLPHAARVLGGRVRFQGLDLLRVPERRMREIRGGGIGMVFQEPMTSLNPVRTIGAQVQETIALHQGTIRRPRVAIALDLLRAVGIPEPRRRLREYPHQLSGGMKQRVMIAMALAGAPRLLIADEPTTALDVTLQAQIIALLRRLQTERGMASLLITHDLGVVAELADRVGVMYAGEIIEESGVRHFFSHPAHPYSRKLFAALPGLENREGTLGVIEGQVPRLDSAFSGCRFAPRCDLADDLCRRQSPPWRALGNGTRVRCHHVERAAAVSGPDTVNDGVPKVSAAADDSPVILLAEDVRVHFPIRRGVLRRSVASVRAVDGVSLQLRRGRTVALVGESGCGKTTLGKALLRLVEMVSGRVELLGEAPGRRTPGDTKHFRRTLQVVFQDPFGSLDPRMLVVDSLTEGMTALGIGRTRDERRRRVMELLGRVGLDPEVLRRYPHEFSGGQRQRLSIARALAVDPRVLVCDEPTSALDVSVQAQILNLLRALQQQFGMAYLFITHNLAVVGYLAHEVAVMYLGRIVEQGTVAEVLRRSAHPYTQALLAAIPSANPEDRLAEIVLPGDPPSAVNPPDGCHYHPRCPRSTESCRRTYPEPHQLTATHRVACWHPG